MRDATEVVVRVFGRTDVGHIRNSNEDNFAVASMDSGELLPFEVTQVLELDGKGPVFIVCDGMGGAAAGEVASRIAVEVVVAELAAAESTDDRAVFGRYLRRAVRTANRRVWEESGSHWKLRGMGTTLTAAALLGDELIVANVGDSRAYVQRGSTLVAVTRDQSVVSALLHSGRITEEEAKNFQQSNVILQALGVSDDVDVALSMVELRRHDRLLMCSDGLCGPVEDEHIQQVLNDHPDVRIAADAMIQDALDAGGPDNVTVVVAEFDGDGLSAPAGADDLPKFVEFDPSEEGARQFTTTSRVAHRLAARAGVGDESGPLPIPSTDQYTAVEGSEPASAELDERARIGMIAWALAVVAIIAVIALLVFGNG